MNKEEFIEKLSQLKEHLPQGSLDVLRESNDKKIAELSAKLENEENYVSSDSVFENNKRRESIQTGLDESDQELLRSQHKVAELQAKITNTQRELDFIPQATHALNDQLSQVSRSLRRNTNPTPEQDQQITIQINNLRSQLNQYSVREAELKGNLAEYQADLSEYQTNLTKFEERSQRYQTLLDNFNNNMQNVNPNINVGKMIDDEEQLSQLQEQKESLDNKFEYSSTDFGTDLDDIIVQLQNDEMTVDEAKKRINSYVKNNITDGNHNMIQMTMDQERDDLEYSREAVSKEIDSLNQKLADESNYEFSAFIDEVNEDKLANAQGRLDSSLAIINKCDEDINTYTNEIASINTHITEAQEIISKLNNENLKLNIRLSTINPVNDKTSYDSLKNMIEKNNDEISLTQQSISDYITRQVTIKSQIDASNSRKMMQQSLSEKYTKEVESIKETSKNRIDQIALNEDKKRLEELVSSAVILDSRIAFTKYNLFGELNDIIGDVDKEVTTNTAEAPVASTQATAPIQKAEDSDIITPVMEATAPIKKSTEVPVTDVNSPVEDTKDNDIIAPVMEATKAPEVTNDNNFNFEDDDEILNEVPDKEIDKDLSNKIRIKGWESPKEALSKKLPELLKKAKTFFKSVKGKIVVAAVVAAAVCGIGSCSAYNSSKNNTYNPNDDNNFKIEDQKDTKDDSKEEKATEAESATEEETTEAAPATEESNENYGIPDSAFTEENGNVAPGQAIDETEEVIEDNKVTIPDDQIPTDSETVRDPVDPTAAKEPKTEIIPGGKTGEKDEPVTDENKPGEKKDEKTDEDKTEDGKKTGEKVEPVEHEKPVDPNADKKPGEKVTPGKQIGDPKDEVEKDEIVYPTGYKGDDIPTPGGNEYPTGYKGDDIPTSKVTIFDGESLEVDDNKGTTTVDSDGNINGDSDTIKDAEKNDDGSATITITGDQIGQSVEEVKEEMKQENAEQAQTELESKTNTAVFADSNYPDLKDLVGNLGASFGESQNTMGGK